jgi:hypothetical protein
MELGIDASILQFLSLFYIDAIHKSSHWVSSQCVIASLSKSPV